MTMKDYYKAVSYFLPTSCSSRKPFLRKWLVCLSPLFFCIIAFMILWIKFSIILQAVDAFTNGDCEKAQKMLEKVCCLYPLSSYWSLDLKFGIFSSPKTIVPHSHRLGLHIIFCYHILKLPSQFPSICLFLP